MLDRYPPEQLIELAWKTEPQACTFGDFPGIPEILAGMKDEEFAEFGLGPLDGAAARPVRRPALLPRAGQGKDARDRRP